MKKKIYALCRQLFREARALPPESWPGFIRERCQDDVELELALAGLLEGCKSTEDPFSGIDPNLHYSALHRIGNWELIDEIGRGGAGIVHRVRRTGAPSSGIAALKLMRPDRLTADAMERFSRERKTLGRLKHKHLARILDIGETPAHVPYFVMEFVDGMCIAEYCRRMRLTIRQRIGLFEQVCVAIQYLHDHGILHSDITSNNLLVMRDGFVKVVDFGVAKTFDPSSTESNQTIGLGRMMTPAYASPEQLAQQKMTRQSDIYSMGVVLYEILTGSLPSEPTPTTNWTLLSTTKEPSVMNPSRRILEVGCKEAGLPETEKQCRNVMKGTIDGIVLTALNRDPVMRYRSAELFRIDLERYLHGLDTSAMEGIFGRKVRGVMRKWRVIVLMAIVGLLAAFGAYNMVENYLLRHSAH